MGELIYGDVPRIIENLQVAADDPAKAYFSDFRSVMAIPHYDRGIGLNMTLSFRREPNAFPPEQFPDWVWMSSLFGRATQNLVLSAELKRAYEVVERELQVVADIGLAPPQDDSAHPDLERGHFLPDVPMGRRRLLRLLPVARRQMGNSDRRRQRSRNPGGRPDGRHPQPGPRLPRSSRPTERLADQGESATHDLLYSPQRGIRHRLLRDL